MSAFVALPILGIDKSTFQATVKGREETWREDRSLARIVGERQRGAMGDEPTS